MPIRCGLGHFDVSAVSWTVGRLLIELTGSAIRFIVVNNFSHLNFNIIIKKC